MAKHAYSATQVMSSLNWRRATLRGIFSDQDSEDSYKYAMRVVDITNPDKSLMLIEPTHPTDSAGNSPQFLNCSLRAVLENCGCRSSLNLVRAEDPTELAPGAVGSQERLIGIHYAGSINQP
jgi:hypothetical protein